MLQIAINRVLARTSRLRLCLAAGLFVSAILIAFTFNSTIAGQSPTISLTIQNLVITKIGETPNAVIYQATVTVDNTGDAHFSGVQRVDYQINNDGAQLAYIITSIPADGSSTFTFNFELQPGDHTIRVVMGDVEASQTVSIAGADVAVKIAEHRILAGSTVEFDIRISNSGELSASDMSLLAKWEDATGDVSGAQSYDGELPALVPEDEALITMPIEIAPGSYRFLFEATTTVPESDSTNNSAQQSLEIEFTDLRVQVLSTESLGWDGDGKALISIGVQVENVGVDDADTFYIGIECSDELTWDCSASIESNQIPAGEKTETELRLWLPVGETPIRVFAVENEATFRWGDSNAIDETITAPNAPEQTWTLNHIAEPDVISYWSDGSANVELELVLVNSGIDEPYFIDIECSQDDAIIEGCGGEFSGELTPDAYPTLLRTLLRLPQGDTTLRFRYGAEEHK